MNSLIERNNKVDILQTKAMDAWISNDYKGLISLPTRSGKSKLGVDATNSSKTLLVVPTIKLRDNGWELEYKKWGKESLYKLIRRECYASIHKIKNENYNLVILDETQFLTERSFEFFKNNKVDKIMMLTATEPYELVKRDLLLQLGPICFKYTLDQAVEDGVLPPYKITVIETELDNRLKYIKAGNKLKPFFVTERQQYTYLTEKIISLKDDESEDYNPSRAKLLELKRMHLLYNLISKETIAKLVICNLIRDHRSLIFCGSIEQAKQLCPHSYHSKDTKQSEIDYNKFIEGEINHLSCVKALNVGVTLPLLDSCLIVQLTSKERDLVQRIGRSLGYREDYIPQIYILSCKDTQDEIWTKSALENINKSNIEYINYKHL